MSNYADRAEDLKRRVFEVAELPTFKKLPHLDALAKEQSCLLHDLAREVDGLKRGKGNADKSSD